MLALPAQGLWLRPAVNSGGVWWAIWAVVLVALIGAGVATYRREQRHRLARPPVITPLLVIEAASIIGGLVLFIVSNVMR